jgi:hypothetical protein
VGGADASAGTATKSASEGEAYVSEQPGVSPEALELERACVRIDNTVAVARLEAACADLHARSLAGHLDALGAEARTLARLLQEDLLAFWEARYGWIWRRRG